MTDSQHKKILFYGEKRDTEPLCTLTNQLTNLSTTLENSLNQSVINIQNGVNAIVIRSNSREKLTSDESTLITIAKELGAPFLLYILDQKLSEQIKTDGIADEKNIHLQKMDDNMKLFLKKLNNIIE